MEKLTIVIARIHITQMPLCIMAGCACVRKALQGIACSNANMGPERVSPTIYDVCGNMKAQSGKFDLCWWFHIGRAPLDAAIMKNVYNSPWNWKPNLPQRDADDIGWVHSSMVESYCLACRRFHILFLTSPGRGSKKTHLRLWRATAKQCRQKWTD